MYILLKMQKKKKINEIYDRIRFFFLFVYIYPSPQIRQSINLPLPTNKATFYIVNNDIQFYCLRCVLPLATLRIYVIFFLLCGNTKVSLLYKINSLLSTGRQVRWKFTHSMYIVCAMKTCVRMVEFDIHLEVSRNQYF